METFTRDIESHWWLITISRCLHEVEDQQERKRIYSKAYHKSIASIRRSEGSEPSNIKEMARAAGTAAVNKWLADRR
jgi:hypothetical protein